MLQELSSDTLHDISVDVKPGELVAVIGPVGAGKVSDCFLLLLLLLPVCCNYQTCHFEHTNDYVLTMYSTILPTTCQCAAQTEAVFIYA